MAAAAKRAHSTLPCRPAAAAAAAAAAAVVKPGVLPARDPQILQKVDAMSTDDAVQFVKAHVVPASYPNVSLQCG